MAWAAWLCYQWKGNQWCGDMGELRTEPPDILMGGAGEYPVGNRRSTCLNF